jgi:hypothetical protein
MLHACFARFASRQKFSKLCYITTLYESNSKLTTRVTERFIF